MAKSPAPGGRDPALYRPNVGLALFNQHGGLFLGRRIGAGLETNAQYQWQMPQGGVDQGESPRQAALRELEEEIGVAPGLVVILEETEDWIYYDFPGDIARRLGQRKERFVGQRQKWFALRFQGRDSDVRLDRHTPEFREWRWGRLEEAAGLIIPFKRPVYEDVARRFARFGNPV
jgi:putative (di)nucleoside polyphosphate hydrolase